MKLSQLALVGFLIAGSMQANPLLIAGNILKNMFACYAIPKIVDVAHESAHYVTGYAVGARPQKITISPLFDENCVSFDPEKWDDIEANSPYKIALISAAGPLVGLAATCLVGKYFSGATNFYTFLNKKENVGICVGMCLALSRQLLSALPSKHQAEDGRQCRTDGQQFLDALNK